MCCTEKKQKTKKKKKNSNNSITGKLSLSVSLCLSLSLPTVIPSLSTSLLAFVSGPLRDITFVADVRDALSLWTIFHRDSVNIDIRSPNKGSVDFVYAEN